jgi:acetolactate synthase-1/3 small subunit
MNREYIIVAFTENQVGVLNRITIAYLRRKINIESLKVSETSMKGISMFVISAFTTEETIQKLTRAINNIVEVIQVSYYTPDELITQEIALYKISSKFIDKGGRIDNISRELGARMIEISPGYVVVEKTGTRQEIEELRDRLDAQGVLLEFTRSGSVVLHRHSLEDIFGEGFTEE